MRGLCLLVLFLPLLCRSQLHSPDDAGTSCSLSRALVSQVKTDPSHRPGTIRKTDQESGKPRKTFAVFNMTGQEVLSGRLESSIDKLETSQLSAGLYVIQVTEGRRQSTFRLIKR